MMERDQIERLLPHRDPFLFADRVLEIDPGTSAVAEHDVTEDAFWCRGHFPGDPVMPGVLIAEALAQVAALIFLTEAQDQAGSTVYLVGMDKMRFRAPVRPGDTLHLSVVLTDLRRRICTFEAQALVDGKRVATGQFMATIPAD
jgi:beta-hydroxyacyl-ACP dehydratase FabZ